MFSGHYIYIEDGSGTSYQVANIESPPIGKTYHTCTVQFYYHLYGTFSSYNYLWIGLTYGGSTSYIWSTSGDQGDKWIKGEFGLGSVPAGKILGVCIKVDLHNQGHNSPTTT
jgi:hypothetical protein